MIGRDENDTQRKIIGVHGGRWVEQGHSQVEEGSRVEEDTVSACIADLLHDKRATIRDSGVQSAT